MYVTNNLSVNRQMRCPILFDDDDDDDSDDPFLSKIREWSKYV